MHWYVNIITLLYLMFYLISYIEYYLWCTLSLSVCGGRRYLLSGLHFPSSAKLATLLQGNTCHQWEPVWQALTLATLWGSRWQFPNESFFYWHGEQKHEKEKKKLPAVRRCKWWFCFTSLSFFFFFLRIKALLNPVQNQHVWPCHEERQPCYLFLS